MPFKGNGKFSKLFHLILRGLYLPTQNKILKGIRPRGTKSCRVSDPAEQWQSCVHFIAEACSAGSDTPQNNAYPAKQNPAGYQTPQNKVLQGIKPRRTTFKYEYIREFETELKNI
jgi:hypothetical protein